MHTFHGIGATLPYKVVVTSGVARIWCRGGGHDDRGAEGTNIDAEWGRVWGEVSLPNRLGGLGERRKLPSGVRAEPRPLSHFLHV